MCRNTFRCRYRHIYNFIQIHIYIYKYVYQNSASRNVVFVQVRREHAACIATCPHEVMNNRCGVAEKHIATYGVVMQIVGVAKL